MDTGSFVSSGPHVGRAGQGRKLERQPFGADVIAGVDHRHVGEGAIDGQILYRLSRGTVRPRVQPAM